MGALLLWHASLAVAAGSCPGGLFQLLLMAESGQPTQLHRASPMTSSRSRPLSQGSSSVNTVTHCRQEHGIRVMSVPEHPVRAERVEAAVQVLMEAAKRVGVFRVAGL